MLNEDQYMDRTPDLIAKVRQMREGAEKEMNRFTRLADYDMSRVVSQKTSDAAESGASQTAIEFSPDVTEQSDGEEAQP
jgi:Spy/CpxP family protein refolding chaperone